jgi:hypothetical protein
VRSITLPALGARPVDLGRTFAPSLIALALLVGACSGGGTPSPAGSTTPAPSVGDNAAMDALAATIPTQVGDVALTVGSGDLTYLSDRIPGYDVLDASLSNAGVQASDVIVALGRPTSGGTDPTVAALEVIAAPPGGLGLLGLMQAWIAGIDGATTENTNIGGKPVVAVMYADGTPPLYYYLFDTQRADAEPSDTLYFVRTADQSLAEAALAQLP